MNMLEGYAYIRVRKFLFIKSSHDYWWLRSDLLGSHGRGWDRRCQVFGSGMLEQKSFSTVKNSTILVCWVSSLLYVYSNKIGSKKNLRPGKQASNTDSEANEFITNWWSLRMSSLPPGEVCDVTTWWSLLVC